jgi:hypothetical protein
VVSVTAESLSIVSVTAATSRVDMSSNQNPCPPATNFALIALRNFPNSSAPIF